MSRFVGFVFILLIIGLVGGAGFLATWDIPAPSETVEAVIADERFEK
ncbi:MAG: hypothetical protein ACPG06_09285 [Alphaproteobacteria bacterium]